MYIKILSICIILFIVGCSSTKYITEYKDVYIPVRVKLDKPDRPVYETTDNIYTYLLKVLDYTKVLEQIITVNNEDTVNE